MKKSKIQEISDEESENFSENSEEKIGKKNKKIFNDSDSDNEDENEEENDDENDDENEDDDDEEDNESEDEENEDEDDCLYDNAELEDDTDFDLEQETSSDKITKPYITKYEKVRIISDRTTQLARGAKPMLKNVRGMDPKEIALLELKNHKIPLIIERELPDGTKEQWRASEFKNL